MSLCRPTKTSIIHKFCITEDQLVKSVFGEALRLNWCSFFSSVIYWNVNVFLYPLWSGLAGALPKETQLGYGFHAKFTCFSSLALGPLELTCLIPRQVPVRNKLSAWWWLQLDGLQWNVGNWIQCKCVFILIKSVMKHFVICVTISHNNRFNFKHVSQNFFTYCRVNPYFPEKLNDVATIQSFVQIFQFSINSTKNVLIDKMAVLCFM